MLKYYLIILLLLISSCEKKIIKPDNNIEKLNFRFFIFLHYKNNEYQGIGISSIELNKYFKARFYDVLFNNYLFDFISEINGSNIILYSSKNIAYYKNDKFISKLFVNLLYLLIVNENNINFVDFGNFDYNIIENKIKKIVFYDYYDVLIIEILKRFNNDIPRRIKISINENYIIFDIIEFINENIDVNFDNFLFIQDNKKLNFFEWLGVLYGEN